MEDANVVAVIAILHFFPLHRDVHFFLGHGLKGIGFRQWYPDVGFSFDRRKFDSIDEFELVRAFNNTWVVSTAHRKRAGHEKHRENQSPHENFILEGSSNLPFRPQPAGTLRHLPLSSFQS